MRKRTVLSAASLTMCLALTACGGSGSQSQGGDSGKPLTVAIWDNNQLPGLKEIIEDFTTETGIEVEIQMVPWDQYWTLLEAGAQGGDLPDVFWMHSNYSQKFMSNDILLDLTDKVAQSSTVDMANYYQDIAELYQYDGKIYGIPKDYDTIGLWYNKTMFDEAEMEYPTADWTWDDMFEAAKKLTKDDGSQYGLALRNDNNQAGYYNMIYDNGGFVINDDKTESGWDDPKTIEAMEQVEEFIKAGVMPSMETMSENGEDVLFQSGKVAMVLQGSWMLAAYRDNEYTAENCDCVELPKSATTDRRVSIYNGLGWAASASGSNTENAWKLIEYLGSEAAQKKQAELGVTMSAYIGTSDAWADSADFNLEAYLNMMDDMVIRPYSKSTVTWENEDNEILKEVYTGDKSMADACKEMADQMNEKLAEE